MKIPISSERIQITSWLIIWLYKYNNVEANNHHGARKSHHIFTDAVAWGLNLNNETFKLYYNHSVMKYDYLWLGDYCGFLTEMVKL